MSTIMYRICIHGLLILSVYIGFCVTLKCYICHTDNNQLCTDEYLQECPKNRAYDRCMTTIYKNAKDGLHIKKECALAPCHMRDPSQKKVINFNEQCDSDKEDCVFCCSEDGCNKDAAPSISANYFLALIMIILCVLSSTASFANITLFIPRYLSRVDG